jgi:chromosome transmission fidelity protein 18
VKFEHVDQGFSVKRTPVPPVLRELLAHGAMVAALREREIESKAGQVPDIQIKSKGKPEEQTTTEPAVIELTEAKAEKRQVARNFLNIGAAKAKEAKSARRAARVGFDRSKKVKLSNTGSGLELSKVIRFKFQKGFTQAVRAPCQMEDLM